MDTRHAVDAHRSCSLPRQALVPALAIGLVAGLTWIACSVLSYATDNATTGAAYTVPAVRAGLAREPGLWVGRTLRIQGIAFQCPLRGGRGQGLCTRAQPILIDSAEMAEPLPLVAPTSNPLPAFLRRLPLLDHLLWTQTPQWDTLATYTVQLQAAPAGACSMPPCYEALLLDAAPGIVSQEID